MIPLLIWCLSATSLFAKPTDSELQAAMANQLVCYPMDIIAVSDPRMILNSEEMCLALIYRELGSKPLWVTPDGPGPKAELILNHIHNSIVHGLNPDEYDLEKLQQLWNSDDPSDLATLDTTLTFSLVKYSHDISHGQLKFHETDPNLFAEAGNGNFNPLTTVKEALAAPDFDKFLDNLPPPHAHYRRLQQALLHYRQLEAAGGWPQIADGGSLRPGERDPRTTTIRQRLAITGELESVDVDDPELYDPELVEAVKRFQDRHGLTVDGIVGKNSREAMNITAAAKVDMIRINLARWRWQARELGKKYILVNIASFNLKAYNDEQEAPALDFPVIVGKDRHQTPVFSDNVVYLDFHPYWNVTPSIAANEDLPALRNDQEHLIKRNIRLFSSWQPGAVELDSTMIDWNEVTPGEMRGYKLRQDPGPWNALGKVKFVFPNRYSVYMHDTASPGLFKRTQRDFSHGCIRVSNPLALAVFVLEGQDGGWTRQKVSSLFQQNTRKVIRLSKPVPVHITYQTTWVDKDGVIHFNRDIYARDKRLLSTLIQ